MRRPSMKVIVDFDLPENKRRVHGFIAPLSGVYEVELSPRRDTRTVQQLRWYWPCVVKPFYEYLRAQDWTIADEEDAHDLLRAKFLRVPMALDEHGKPKAWRTRRTRELTVSEFSDYVERARAWLLDFFGIVTVAPDGSETPNVGRERVPA